jgi:4-hydroxy-2-oxoglutarate aldolase
LAEERCGGTSAADRLTLELFRDGPVRDARGKRPSQEDDMSIERLRLDGIYPPIPTPFDTQGNVALDALSDNLALWNQHDLRGYVVLGSNGEFVYLTEGEKRRVLETARDAIPGDKLLIAGTGCEGTDRTCELTRQAASIGADAALVLTPSYYTGRMTPDALVEHYRRVADSSPIPILVYNMPANTGIDLSAEAVAAMAQHSNIIGMKESGGSVIKMGAIRGLAGPEFQVLAGSASFLLPSLSVGAAGGVNALANIAPEQCLALHRLFLEGRREEARDLQVRLIPVNSAVTSRWGVPALKAAMDMLGWYGGPVRAPLKPVPESVRAKLEGILETGGIRHRQSDAESRT